MNNPVSIVGTVATEPKRIVTQAGVTLCTFRLASGERRYDREQQKWIDGETNWFGVTVFRALAEHALESFRKGERVIVTGKLRVRRWETDEKSGTSVDIEAEALGHDLRWGVSSFEKRVVGAETVPSSTQQSSAQQSSAQPSSASATGVSTPPAGSKLNGDGFIPVAV